MPRSTTSRAAVERKRSETVPLGTLFIAFSQGLAIRGRRWRRAGLVAPHRCRSAPVDNRTGFRRYRELVPVSARSEHCRHRRLRRNKAARHSRGNRRCAGFLLIPWTIGFVLGLMYLQHAHHPVLQNILGGISAVAAGLLIATGIRMLLPHRGRPTALLFAALAFGLMGFGSLPLLVVLFSLVPLSIAVAGFQSARAR